MDAAAGFRRLRALCAHFSLRTNLIVLLALAVAILIGDRAHEMTLLRDQELTRTRAEIMDMARRGAERQADVIADAKALLTLAVNLPLSATERRLRLP